MAKSGDKKRIEENRNHVRNLQILIAVSNAVFILVRLLLRKSTTSWWHYFGLALTTAIFAFCYRSISYALAPHFNSGGELVYSGADLKTGGVLSYYHDLLYISAFVLLAGAATNWAWLAFAAVPAYALYKLWQHVLHPYLTTPSFKDLPESEMDRKRREKRERQTARAQKFMQGRK